ncbi:MAG: PepSY domain-containing protein [Methylocystis sp.]|uniref:PepSY domain-containing protein n=1 Tax=Methylocystis sp. TaxID=1911079 RepID=UPI003DA5C08C
MRILVTCIALLGLVGMAATPAQADRRLTRQEKSSIRSAMKDMGCSGGKMEFDDGRFEVDDARCRGGKKYDLTFDQNFKMTSKELENGRGGYYGSGRYNTRDNTRSHRRGVY